jgi:hypothetical protein
MDETCLERSCLCWQEREQVVAIGLPKVARVLELVGGGFLLEGVP